MIKAAWRAALRESLARGGAVLRRRFGSVTVRYKGRANPVTEADLESQKAILSVLRRRCPDHDFLGEEDARRRTGSPYTWVFDPLDGTTNYAHGYPVCCVSVGLLHGVRPVLGGVYDPFRDELFLAEKGRGTTLNGRKVSVTKTPGLDAALLVTGFGYDRAERAGWYTERYRRFLRECHDIRRSGSAALDLAWLAAGRYDGFWEFKLSPWDVAAGMLLVAEAGGRVTDVAGRPWARLEDFGRQTLATNGRIHAAMRRVLGR